MSICRQGTGRNLLETLLHRGDRVSIRSGRLFIHPKSEATVPPEWMKRHQESIIAAISQCIQIPAYSYVGYSTGLFNKGRAPGVSLQFENIATLFPAYAIFNVGVTRTRNTIHGKAGTMLPAKHFRAPPAGGFVRFWKRTGLPLPRRYSSFHDYMGQLHTITFTGDISKSERMEKNSLRPLEVSMGEITAGLQSLRSPDSPQTNHGQLPDNHRTSNPDKQSAETECPQGIPENPAAGDSHYGTPVKGDAVDGAKPKNNVVLFNDSRADPCNQSTEEWLERYAHRSEER